MRAKRGMVLAGFTITASIAAGTAHAEPSSVSPEQGYDLGEVPNARGLGMGGANVALGISTAAIFQNPANLALARVYHFEGLAGFGPEARRQTYGGAVADSVLNRYRIAGGFGGAWSTMDPEGLRRSWTDLRGSLAYALGDSLAVGLTGRYLRVDQSVASGPLGASLASDGTRGDPFFNQLTLDVGLTAALGDKLRIGAVGKNLTVPNTALAPTTLTGGIGFLSRDFAFEGDVQVDFTTWNKARPRFMGGAEVFVADRYAIRVGYRYDDGTRTHAPSVGAGYIDKKWSFEVSARRDVAGEHPATFLGVSLRYFYDATPLSQDEPDTM